MAIKLGNQEITLKVGSNDVSAAYLGSTLVYSGGTPPTPSFNGKWLATYTGGTTSSAQCDASSAITQNEITKSGLTSVEIGDCVTSIGQYAFYSYSGLTNVTIPNSVTSIGQSAFNSCYGLTDITLGSGLTTIGESAFNNCSSLTTVTIGKRVTTIGDGAFGDCSSLQSITCLAVVPPTLDGSAFDNTNDCPIYVRQESLSDYQSEWADYEDRIRPI